MSNILVDPVVEISFLRESKKDSKEKNYYIEGIFMQSEIVNGNGRKYQKWEMEKEIEKYNKEKIANNAGWGELDHPSSSNMNMSKMSHLFVTPLKMEGNSVIGKAKILDNIWGGIVKTAIDEGIPFGVSSRGNGFTISKENYTLVEQFQLITPADIVENPSAPGARPSAFSEMLVEAITSNHKEITNNIDNSVINNVNTIVNNAAKKELDEAIIKAYWEVINSIINK